MEISKQRQTFPSSAFVSLTVCLAVCAAYTRAQELKLESVVQFLSTGPVVYVHCTATFPKGTSGYTIIWFIDGEDSFVNEVRREHTSPRYNANYFQDVRNTGNITYTSTLNINNAVKQDEGLYKCQAQYVQKDNNITSYMDAIHVSIHQYLPAENYPECSLESANGFFAGNSITFTCLTGNSNPNVTLRLALNRTDGSEIKTGNDFYTGNASATVLFPASEDKVTFMCYMTSDTFKTASRMCSVGPFTILSPSTTKSVSTVAKKYEAKTSYESQSTPSYESLSKNTRKYS